MSQENWRKRSQENRASPRDYGKVTQQWVIVGGKKFYSRSTWETLRARQLQWMKEAGVILDWDHEPLIFYFPNVKSGPPQYKPDFRITLPDGTHYWEEIKGMVQSSDRTKAKRMKKYFPDEKIYYLRKRKDNFERFEILKK